MDLFVEGALNPLAFDPALWQGTHQMSDVLLAAAHTQSARIESTHFLMVLPRIPRSATASTLQRLGVTPEQWESGLAACAVSDRAAMPPGHLTADSLDASATAMLADAAERCRHSDGPQINEMGLLLGGLQNVTPAVEALFKSAGIDLAGWRNEIESQLRPIQPIDVFESQPAGALRWEAFSARARRILTLVKSEAESLGYAVADSRHLLLALLAQGSGPGGATHYAIHQQNILPRRIQEAVMLSLRGRARAQRVQIPLDREHLQAALRRILVLAGELAARDRAQTVAEPHLLRAFLEVETAARRILEDERLSLDGMRDTACRSDTIEEPAEPEPAGGELTIADIDTVRKRLLARLVGQDEAIQQVLPYIERMRFGFSLPGRPVGVFLFCGPSGVGKTELAKELARAVFGSEESLTFLEMGQFNARESMNIFVGAPPGYVGYGEGKLTNGLRDKPHSVVLFDEVEKAHPLVLDALLRFLDEGRIDDPAGPVRDGSRCVVVLTSNLGSKALADFWRQIATDPNWRTPIRRKMRAVFEERQFRAEFLNRVDELVFFRPLSEADYSEISRRVLAASLQRLRDERQIEIELDGVCEAIGRYCASVDEGARAAQRLAMSVVVTPVINHVLRNRLTPPVRLRVQAIRPTDDSDCEPYGVVGSPDTTTAGEARK